MRVEKINKDIPAEWFKQSGVIPFRRTNGKIEVLLITNRSGKKWIVPKGIIESGLDAKQSAVKEALEEAGIEGKVENKELGNYKYSKWGGKCNVRVFPMEVKTLLKKWEEDFRKRKWYDLNEARELLKEEKLKVLIDKLKNWVKN